ncbi:MAG: hypothetical protein ACYCV4_15365 [Dermatophilaceae bacterium]
MAEDTSTKEPTKGTKKPSSSTSLMKKKVGGIPVPILLVGGGVAAYLLYKHFAGSSSSTTPATTGTTTGTGTGTGTGGGTGGGGDGGGGGGPTTPPTTPPKHKGKTGKTGTTGTGAKKNSIIPIGKQTIRVNGKPYQTVSGFQQGGKTYFGISNPAEAKRLRAEGVDLVPNPRGGKGLFAVENAGQTGYEMTPTHHGAPASNHLPVATGHSGSGVDYSGTGATGASAPLSSAATANERKAGNIKAANLRRAANRRAANARRAANRAKSAQHSGLPQPQPASVNRTAMHARRA